MTIYEEEYKTQEYYWGTEPNKACYQVLLLMPPIKPLKLLDIGYGEGKDAVFFARNGYVVRSKVVVFLLSLFTITRIVLKNDSINKNAIHVNISIL